MAPWIFSIWLEGEKKIRIHFLWLCVRLCCHLVFTLCTFLRGHHPEARGHLSEALTEDTGVGNSVAGSPLPLTTGNENLDVAIVIHLQYCNHLIQVAPPSHPACRDE